MTTSAQQPIKDWRQTKINSTATPLLSISKIPFSGQTSNDLHFPMQPTICCMFPVATDYAFHNLIQSAANSINICEKTTTCMYNIVIYTTTLNIRRQEVEPACMCMQTAECFNKIPEYFLRIQKFLLPQESRSKRDLLEVTSSGN